MRNTQTHTRSRRQIRRATRRAFTLLEMMVVVTVIALLATLIGPKVFKAIFKANVAVAKQQTSQIHNAVSEWLMDSNLSSVPSDFSLEQLAEGDNRVLEKSDLIDPWGNPYVIDPDGLAIDFDVISYGEDGQPGGEEAAMDIINGKTSDQF